VHCQQQTIARIVFGIQTFRTEAIDLEEGQAVRWNASFSIGPIQAGDLYFAIYDDATATIPVGWCSLKIPSKKVQRVNNEATEVANVVATLKSLRKARQNRALLDVSYQKDKLQEDHFQRLQKLTTEWVEADLDMIDKTQTLRLINKDGNEIDAELDVVIEYASDPQDSEKSGVLQVDAITETRDESIPDASTTTATVHSDEIQSTSRTATQVSKSTCQDIALKTSNSSSSSEDSSEALKRLWKVTNALQAENSRLKAMTIRPTDSRKQYIEPRRAPPVLLRSESKFKLLPKVSTPSFLERRKEGVYSTFVPQNETTKFKELSKTSGPTFLEQRQHKHDINNSEEQSSCGCISKTELSVKMQKIQLYLRR